MANNFRRDIRGDVLSVLNSRKSLYNSNIPGDQYYKPATRPTGWAKIIKQGLEVSTYVDEVTFSSVYQTGFKPKPVLQRLEVERVGQDASTVNLHLRIRAEFECLDYDDFKEYSEVFCKTDPDNKLTVKFGHVDPPDGYSDTIEYTNVYIVYGMFESTKKNSFRCRFEAITGGEAVPSIDILGLGSIKIGGKELKYLNDFNFGTRTDKETVRGIYELLLYDAQVSGKIHTSKAPDGQVIPASKIDYGNVKGMFSKLNITNEGHIAIYEPVPGFSQFNFSERWSKFINQDPAGTREQEYYSLEYITARILNQFGINKFLEKYPKGNQLDGAAIGFPDEPYSYVPPGGNIVLRSCDPYSMLICGNDAGNYLQNKTGPKGKNWDEQVGGKIHAYNGQRIDYRKILIHRDSIKTIFESAVINKTEKNTSENPRAEPNDERILPIKTFCDSLFNFIKVNTGGHINLGLIIDDEDPDQIIIRIIDLHYSRDSFNMWRFEVLTGDGNTRNLIHRSRHPSNEFHAALLQEIAGYSRVPDKITGPIDNKAGERMDIIKELQDIWYNKMPKNSFSSETIESARRLMARYLSILPTDEMRQRNFYVWLLEMNIVMDGLDGWQIGNHITSDNLPEAYSDTNKIGFVVKRVHHIIENNNWRTELDAISTALPDGAYLAS